MHIDGQKSFIARQHSASVQSAIMIQQFCLSVCLYVCHVLVLCLKMTEPIVTESTLRSIDGIQAKIIT